MSCTQTAAPHPAAAVGTILLHPRPSARNSGVLVLVPLLADVHSAESKEPPSPTVRVAVAADGGDHALPTPPPPTPPPPKPSPKPSAPVSPPLSAAPDRPFLLSSIAIAGLPYKRRRAKGGCDAAAARGGPPPLAVVVLADSGSGLPCRRAAESVSSRPAATAMVSEELPCELRDYRVSSTTTTTTTTTEVSREPPLPLPRTLTLPAETWFRVLAFVFAPPPGSIGAEERRARACLLSVSKTFKNLASPLFYAYPHFSAPSTLTEFTRVLQASDRAWDSIRRIPYSTPGRWVQALDFSRISCTTAAERLAVDTLLTQLFPLTPFLARLVLNSTVRMSRRAMLALASRETAGLLRVLKGVKWEGAGMAVWNVTEEDPLLELVRASVGLEELEVFGPGLLDDDEDGAVTPQLNTPPPTPRPHLFLPNLHSLMILSLPKSPLLSSLVRSPLPSLRHLMVTPYDGVPSALTSALITTHGARLHTLAFHTPKTWPPIRAATPPTLLHTSPHLRALSLTFPLPALVPPPPAPATGHPLRILSLPRPDPGYLFKLEAWLYLGLLQSLEEVHMREVRWIRAGVSSRAAEAGVQGDMKEWKRRLGRWRVRVVDVRGKEDVL